jgi:hypothetical protein
MNRPHLSDDELIGLLYGLGNMDDDESHLAGCSECIERLKAMEKVRRDAADAPQISARILAVQRLTILGRLAQPSPVSLGWRWVPVATAASLLAAALFLYQRPRVPAPPVPPTTAVNAEADAALFTDVYAMEQDVEPRAAAPIRGLFQETSFDPISGERQ